MGRSFMPLILNGDREKIEENIASLSHRNSVTTYEHRVLTLDGEVRWQQWTIQAIFGKGERENDKET